MLPRSTHDPFAHLVHRLAPGSTLIRAWPLTGGVSADITALEWTEPDGERRRAVVRRHGPADLAANPHVARDEFRLLRVLHAAGIPVPAPLLVEPSGDIFPTPCLVVEYVDGSTAVAPAHLANALRQLAARLAQIHAIDPARAGLDFLPDHAERVTERLRQPPPELDDSLSEGVIRAALATAWPIPSPRNPTVLLHGDFWPGNVLWRDGQLAAILDWENGRRGDPLADLGNARLELLWAFGPDAMRDFTTHYQSLTRLDVAHLPVYDLIAALKPAHQLATWGLDPAVEATMRERHHQFVAHALANLPRP